MTRFNRVSNCFLLTCVTHELLAAAPLAAGRGPQAPWTVMTVVVAGIAASADAAPFFVSFPSGGFAAGEAGVADLDVLCAAAGVCVGLAVCATAVPAASSPIMASFNM